MAKGFVGQAQSLDKPRRWTSPVVVQRGQEVFKKTQKLTQNWKWQKLKKLDVRYDPVGHTGMPPRVFFVKFIACRNAEDCLARRLTQCKHKNSRYYILHIFGRNFKAEKIKLKKHMVRLKCVSMSESANSPWLVRKTQNNQASRDDVFSHLWVGTRALTWLAGSWGIGVGFKNRWGNRWAVYLVGECRPWRRIIANTDNFWQVGIATCGKLPNSYALFFLQSYIHANVSAGECCSEINQLPSSGLRGLQTA